MCFQTRGRMTNFIWSICSLLRRPFERHEYRKVIPLLTVSHHFDSILESTKAKVLAVYQILKTFIDCMALMKGFI